MRLVKYTCIVLKEKLGKHSCLRIYRTIICVKCKKKLIQEEKIYRQGCYYTPLAMTERSKDIIIKEERNKGRRKETKAT